MMNGQDPITDLPPKESDAPRPFPRKITLGLILILLGVFLVLKNMGFVNDSDFVEFMPVALITLGVLRVLKKGLFSVLAQTMMVGGVLMHIALLGNQAAKNWWLPTLIIWAGLLVLIKGVITLKKPKDGEEAGSSPMSRYRWGIRSSTSDAEGGAISETGQTESELGETHNE